MKYVKTLGLLVVAAAALMAFAGTASATLTDGIGNEPTTVHFTSESDVTMTGSAITVTCKHTTIHFHVAINEANHVGGPNTSTAFEGCNHTVTVVKPGSLTATDTGTNTADVFSTGAEVTMLMHTFFFGTIHCTFVTNNTTMGTLTGTGHKDNKTTTATFDTNATIPVDPETSDDLCGETTVWEGSYVVTSPDHLVID